MRKWRRNSGAGTVESVLAPFLQNAGCTKPRPAVRLAMEFVPSQEPSNCQTVSGKWSCIGSQSAVSSPDAHKIPLPTEKTRSFCGARRRKYWIAAIRRSADIVRGQSSAALTAAANVNAGNSQHDLPCGQLAVGGHGRFCPRQPLRQLQPRFLLRIAQKSVVADLHKTLRKNVHQDAANELYRGQRHDLLPVAIPVITPLERDRSVFAGKDTLVGNRYAVRIASEIFQHMTCAPERRLTVDDPFFCVHGAEICLKYRLRLELFAVSVQNQIVFYEIQLMQKFAAKFSAENLYRQKKAVFGFTPLPVRCQNAARNDLVDMRMKLQLLSPCMKN